MKKIATALLLSTAISAPALAADQGAYVNADLGQANFSNATSQFSTTKFGNPGSITIGGGYHFSQNVGVEAGYSIIGDSTITTNAGGGASTGEKLKTSSMQVAAVGTFPINDKFDLFGKLGVANTKIDYSAIAAGGTFVPSVAQTASASKTNLMFGIGGQFNINKRFGIRLQYQDFGKVQLPGLFFGGVNAPNISVQVFSVGGVYNF